MKKIAICTCYYQHNYGSMLQSYATQLVLDKLGIDSETINVSKLMKQIKRKKRKYFLHASFTSDFIFVKFGRLKSYIRRCFSIDNYSKKIKIRDQYFDVFLKKNIRLSFPFENRKELIKSIGNYAAVIVGSDQLWLPGNIAGDFFTLSFCPKEINTIAYATSFGVEELPRNIQNTASFFLKNINHISVREKRGQDIIACLTKRKVPVVCDPTLLLTGEEWLCIQKKDAIYNEPYIFCYFLGNNINHRKFAIELKKSTGYKIIALANLDEFVKIDEQYSDYAPYDIDPGDFINLVRHANFICTDSFHCSAFSILYKKLFFTFNRFSDNSQNSTNNRIETLLGSMGLVERIMTGNEKISDVIDKSIDYKKVFERLDENREKSYNYLISALKDERSTDIDSFF